jgi:hypothetical protein
MGVLAFFLLDEVGSKPCASNARAEALTTNLVLTGQVHYITIYKDES